MKIAFYNASPRGPVPAPDTNLLIGVGHIEAVPRPGWTEALPGRADTVVIAGSTWIVDSVVHFIKPGDDSEIRVWLRPQH